MPGRFAELCCAGLLTIGLGFTLVEDTQIPWAWDVCLLIVSLTALGYWVVAARSISIPPSQLWLGVGVLVLPAYVVLQLIPLPVFLLRILSPARVHLVQSLSNGMEAPRFASISIAPSVTFAYLIRTVGYVVVFLLVRELASRLPGRWRWTLFAPLIAIAAAEAAMGLSQITPKVSAHGTYVNRDHFAGLLEMILPGAVALGLAIGGLAGGGVLVIATLIFLGILYSLSKTGFVAALGELFIMGALGLGRRLTPGKRWLAIALLAVVVLAAFVFLPPDQVVGGIGGLFTDDTTGEGRFPIWADSLHLIAAYPLFGVGLGGYEDAFYKYQTAVVDHVFDHAHNDYLQLLAELGIVGFLLLAGFVFLVFRSAVRAATRSANADIRYLGLGCVGGMVAIGLHSFTDFNMYIPANAFVFTWIAGMAAGLSAAPRKMGRVEKAEESLFFKTITVLLSGVLGIYALAWTIFDHSFLSDPQAERLFCRFGICNTSAMFGGDPAAIPLDYLVEAVRRHPANPRRWSDLGQAMWDAGQIEKAQLYFSNAAAVGPNLPGILLSIADFDHGIGKDSLALEQTSRALAKTVVLDQRFFDWFKNTKIPVREVVSDGLPPEPGVFRAYLRSLISANDIEGAHVAWDALLAHGYADDQVALEYVNFLSGQKQFESAARTWAAYLGDRRNGYLESNWLFNGDFESEPSNLFFDWSTTGGDGVEIARDAEVKHSGAYSLRIHFSGRQNLTDAHVGQRAFVTTGRYRFEAYAKTEDLTTDQGISLRVSDATGASRLDMRTEPLLGTHDWTRVNLDFCVARPTNLLQASVVRQPSLKFDNLIKGTLWLDSVNLNRLAQNCAG